MPLCSASFIQLLVYTPDSNIRKSHNIYNLVDNLQLKHILICINLYYCCLDFIIMLGKLCLPDTKFMPSVYPWMLLPSFNWIWNRCITWLSAFVTRFTANASQILLFIILYITTVFPFTLYLVVLLHGNQNITSQNSTINSIKLPFKQTILPSKN